MGETRTAPLPRPGRGGSLAELRPDLAAQWHPTGNGEVTPVDVTPGSRLIAWWRCPRGHEWAAPVGRRRRHGCPVCAGRKAGPDTSMAARRPDLAAEWHPEKNGSVTPAGVTTGSTRKVWWICPRGHEWLASVRHRAKGTGCPFCSGHFPAPESSLAARRPDLAAQWDDAGNQPLTPAGVSPGSGRRVWWACSRGHRWRASVGKRALGSGCPYCLGRRLCAGNTLRDRFPEVAAQWHPARNGGLGPADVLPGDNRHVLWRCAQGHEWPATVNMRTTRRTGCPYCAGQLCPPERSLAGRFPELAREWHPALNGPLRPDMVAPHSRRRPWWVCRRGHAYRCTVADKVRGRGCPECEGKAGY